MDLLRVTMADFGDWLRTFAPTDEVGQASSSCNCPLARYLGTLVPDALLITVDGDSIRIDDAVYPLHDWAADFVEIVDVGMNVEIVPVTAEYVVAVWEDVAYDQESSVETLPLVFPASLVTP